MILQCPINKLSYGICSSNIARELAKLTNLTIYPIGQIDKELYEDLYKLDWRNKHVTLLNKSSATSLKIFHQNNLHEHPTTAKVNVGFPIFELNRLTNEEIKSMKHCDEIFVCSEWARDIVSNSGVGRSVCVVPLGVDRNIFNEHGNSTRPATVFFNIGKWEIRKGHDILIECFNRAFTQTDNVELWMMPHNYFIGDKNKEWESLYRSSKLGDKIRFIPRLESQEDVYNIMRQADCGVFPTRAEGWNLPLLEFMSCGKQVITTDYSGHTQYADDKNSHLININAFEPAQDGIWFFGQGDWAKITEDNKDQLIHHMRMIHNLKKDGDLQMNQAGIDTARNHTWRHTAEKIIELLGV